VDDELAKMKGELGSPGAAAQIASAGPAPGGEGPDPQRQGESGQP
jgi:hypothetical protein